MTREEFLRREQRQEFLEHAEYDGNLYGTPAAPIREALDQGRTILLDIDVQGGRQFREQIPDALTIFLLPPTKDALLRRLDQRRTDTPAAQERRIAKAAEEERFARESDLYDYFVVNDDLDLTVKEIGDIIGELGESDD
jgi:guanylate kinase